MLDKKANVFEVQYLYGKHRRRCGGHKREGTCALPGEVCLTCHVLPSSQGVGMGKQKSAEGIVGLFDQAEGPNMNF